MTLRHRGMTLVEQLIVVSVVAVVLIAITMVISSAARVYARYSPRVEPESSMLLALSRMQQNMRDAILIDLNSTANCVEIGLPVKDSHQLNVLSDTGLQIGKRVCYFLGRYDNDAAPTAVIPYVIPNVPVDDSQTRYALFSIEQDGDVSNLPLQASYPVSQVKEIINGIVRQPLDPNDPTGTATTSIFSYTPLDANGNITADTRLIRIVLTYPTKETTSAGTSTLPLTLWTQFCLRNKQPGT